MQSVDTASLFIPHEVIRYLFFQPRSCTCSFAFPSASMQATPLSASDRWSSLITSLTTFSKMSMSPFFKPGIAKGPLFSCYKNSMYTLMSTIGLSLIITIPWFLGFVRDVMNEESRTGPVSEALVYSTTVVLIVVIISFLFFASYIVSIETFRGCMTIGTISLFAPLLLAHQWRYVYAIAIMISQLLLGLTFVIFSVLIIRYESSGGNNERRFGYS